VPRTSMQHGYLVGAYVLYGQCRSLPRCSSKLPLKTAVHLLALHADTSTLADLASASDSSSCSQITLVALDEAVEAVEAAYENTVEKISYTSFIKYRPMQPT
jgi:hypothetical protein